MFNFISSHPGYYLLHNSHVTSIFLITTQVLTSSFSML